MAGYPEKSRARLKSIGPWTICVLIGAVATYTVTLDRCVSAASTPNFTTDVAPILQKNCNICHSHIAHKSDLVMDSYDSLMRGGKHGQAIVPHDANGSRMVAMLEGKLIPRMPLDDDPLSSADIAVIKSWIDAGAVGPTPNDNSHPLPTPSTPIIRPEVPVVSPLSSLRFSPDGTVLAVGGYQQVRLIDPVSGKMLATLSGHADYVRSIAFSPDGKMIAAAGGAPQRDGEIKIWNVHSQEPLKTMQGHKDCIYSVAWSPDGKLIASASYDRAVKLWDAATGKEVRNLQDHIDAVFAVAFSPDGKRLASASQDRTVKIWDVVSGRRLYTLSDSSDGLTSVAYSPSGDQVAAVGYDKTIYVWRLTEDDGHLSQSLIADEDSLLALVWSPDGKTIVTASSDGSIRFRDNKLDLIGVIDRQPDWVDTLAMSPDNKWLAAGRYNGTLSLYDAKTYKETRGNMVVFDALKPASRDKGPEAASR
jgi:WD40 repeat protein